jgi:hypothetical protein
LWVAAVAVAVVSGCTTSEGKTMATPIEQRPPIEQVEQEYLAMLEKAQRVLTDELGVGAWIEHRETVGEARCGPDDEDGVERTYNLGTAGPIPDEDWDRAVEAVAGAVGPHGFTEVDEYLDRPGDHSVHIDHPDGARVSFGTARATILSVTTGCHLTEETLAARAGG